MNRIIIQRSYAHSLKELTILNYLFEDQIKFIDWQTLNQLKDIIIDVSKRKCKNTMGQMICIETALLKKTLLAWFKKKIKSQNLEIHAFTKMQYERNNPVNWKNDKCVICNMSLKIEPTNFETPDDEITYGDFVIRFEHMFLRNIYTYDQIKESHHLETLEKYYKIFQKFIAISIGLLSMFNNYNKNDKMNTEVSDFREENNADDTIDEFKNRIMQTEIKNAIKSSAGKVPKLNLKIYAFVYNLLLYFPLTEKQYEILTTNSFFINVHCLRKIKIYLHHSHVTGKILGYDHDFCNKKVTEKGEPDIPVIAHNLFAFGLYYFIKGYIASAWCLNKIEYWQNKFKTH